MKSFNHSVKKIVLLLVVMCLSLCFISTAQAATIYVATFYPEYLPQNGMFIATSSDGVNFTNAFDNDSPIYAPSTGVRDSTIIFYEGKFWLLYTYGWPPSDVPPNLYIAGSKDLLNWTPEVTIQLGETSDNNYVDVPQWLVDSSGNVHIICCVDSSHNWVEIHPNSPDSSTWNNPANWSAKSNMTDIHGTPLVQGNSFVTRKDGTWYMMYNAPGNGEYFRRTSTDLVQNWSDGTLLSVDCMLGGDTLNTMFLPNGDMRLYISNGNWGLNKIWAFDSPDAGITWSNPTLLAFHGYQKILVNWAEIHVFTDPTAINAISALNLNVTLSNVADQAPITGWQDNASPNGINFGSDTSRWVCSATGPSGKEACMNAFSGTSATRSIRMSTGKRLKSVYVRPTNGVTGNITFTAPGSGNPKVGPLPLADQVYNLSSWTKPCTRVDIALTNIANGVPGHVGFDNFVFGK